MKELSPRLEGVVGKINHELASLEDGDRKAVLSRFEYINKPPSTVDVKATEEKVVVQASRKK